ncbi:MAG: nitrate reductase [Proteobacteria bacterium]|nr:nitrate reductase [Pseudomonadota bacterium]
MHNLYILATGPLLYLSFALFFGGMFIQILFLVIETYRKERFMFSFLSLSSVLMSVAHWLFPFGSTVMRREKTLTLMGFGFHIGLFILPVFLFDHVLLIYESWGVYWLTLSGMVPDVLSVFVLSACVYFLFRRSTKPEIRYISTPIDYLIPLLVIFPVATGLWASHRLPGYPIAHITHILSGELLLSAIPFTRLSHMVLGFFTRVYTSSEFGRTRAAHDW